MEHVSLMMAGAQLGITIASLALGSMSEPAIAQLLEAPMELAGVPGSFRHPISFSLALTLVTFDVRQAQAARALGFSVAGT